MSAESAVPIGNRYDKYGTRNPLARRLIAGFRDDLDELVERIRPRSILDVGCGEGVLTIDWAERYPDTRVVGLDLPNDALRAEWSSRRQRNLRFIAGDAANLPFADAEFDLVSAIEVLEHVSDPRAVMAEMRRVARSALIISVPREPLWRLLNIARGAYLMSLGNTPGHLHHWSQGGIRRFVSEYARIEEVRDPLPWTMLLARLD
jgi:ubiquinone/menaquinone biosynthesis C-methylase UbiE